MAAAPPPESPSSIIFRRRPARCLLQGEGWGEGLGNQLTVGRWELGRRRTKGFARSYVCAVREWGDARRTGGIESLSQSSRAPCLSLAMAQGQAHKADGFAPSSLRKCR
jgi:hypothetical protein